MNIETLSAYQTIKYDFKARKTRALTNFKRNDVRKDPVKKCFCICPRKAAPKYKQEQERKKEMKEKRKEQLNVSVTNSACLSKERSRSVTEVKVIFHTEDEQESSKEAPDTTNAPEEPSVSNPQQTIFPMLPPLQQILFPTLLPLQESFPPPHQ